MLEPDEVQAAAGNAPAPAVSVALTPDGILGAALQLGVSEVAISVEGSGTTVLGFPASGDGVRRIATADRSAGQRLLAGLQRRAGLPPGRPPHPITGFLTTGEEGGRDVELTVIPALGGEHAALSVRSVHTPCRQIAQLGLEPGDLARLRSLLEVRAGLFVVTGDARSGRSTAFRAILDNLACSGRRVVALARSVSHPRRGVTYLRLADGDPHPPEAWVASALRLHPEVLALDDIFDRQAYLQAVRAVAGGRLVVLVLPGDDAVAAARALESLDLPRGLVSASLCGVLAGRLVLRSCPECRTPRDLPIELRAAVRTLGGPAEGSYVETAGCAACSFTGIAALQPLFELCGIDDAAREQLASGSAEQELSGHIAASRPTSIRAQAARLAAAGELTVTELARVL